MQIKILTLFPEIFTPFLTTSIIKRARGKNLVKIQTSNIRDFALNKHGTVDDKPYGGGIGMLMRVDVLHKALVSKPKGYKILLSPKGKRYAQADAKRLARKKSLILLCGHYEGMDARIENYVDEMISIGDYVLTGGEIPAMVIVDSIIRLLPGVLPTGATESESFENNLLEYPQFTRPAVFKRKQVPRVLLSGNHAAIAKWRKAKQLETIPI